MNQNQRLRVEVAGDPKWHGEQNRLELVYDELTDTFRAYQPVKIDDSRLDSPLADHSAALDVGVNNLVACTVSIGSQYLYDGRDLFEEFRATTEQIAYYQALLEDQKETSKRIDRLYRKRTNRRNHAQDTLVRTLVEQLYDEGVSTLYVGDIKGVLDTHWSSRVNEKTHTTSGRTVGLSIASNLSARNMDSALKRSQKRGRVKRALNAESGIRRCIRVTCSRVRVNLKDTRPS